MAGNWGVLLPQNRCLLAESHVIMKLVHWKNFREMPKQKLSSRQREKALDKLSEKRGRGRPQNIPPAWVIGRAQNYRYMLSQVWPKLGAPLAAAKMEEQITAAFEGNAQPYAAEFVPRLASDILTLMRDPDFPKRPKARVGFLADSLAGRPSIEPRTSRDICGKARARRRSKSPHRIIRKEFYVECSCGYKGPARDNACQRCGAQIPITLEELWGNPRLF